jgi:hypothetical protein
MNIDKYFNTLFGILNSWMPIHMNLFVPRMKLLSFTAGH